MEPTLANRVARRHLRARSSEDGILINVWDDSPPHAPIMIEGEWPEEVNKASFIDFLAGYLSSRGFDVRTRSTSWKGANGPSEFEVMHPELYTLEDWRTKSDSGEHMKFLDSIIGHLSTLEEYCGHKVKVISES